MRHLIYLTLGLLTSWLTLAACHDTESYADLVKSEKKTIKRWTTDNPYGIEFGNIISHDEEWLNDVTRQVLTDSVHPSRFIELGQWYTFTNSDFKRYYFRINSWGDEPAAGQSFYTGKITSDQYEKPGGGHYASSNVMVRYDSLILISDFDYTKPSANTVANNLDPNSYLLIYSWRTNYYASTYYSMYYATGSSYECTSGGLAFPCRFLWYGGSASMIVPFSITDQNYASYYYTLWYGNVYYTKPNYLPR